MGSGCTERVSNKLSLHTYLKACILLLQSSPSHATLACSVLFNYRRLVLAPLRVSVSYAHAYRSNNTQQYPETLNGAPVHLGKAVIQLQDFCMLLSELCQKKAECVVVSTKHC